MIISGIYKIQSQIKPQRIYIGSSVNINNRRYQHLSDLKNNHHTSKKLQRHYNKYGKDDLLFSIILGCDKEDLIKHEQFFIDSLNPYFNSREIAENNLGHKWSDESRNKLSQSLKKRFSDPKEIEKISMAHKGKKLTEEQKEKIGKKSKGRTHSLITREKLRIANIGRHLSEETKQKLSKHFKGHSAYNKGIKLTEEQKKKISESLKGRIAWNKGKKTGIKLPHAFSKGHTPWNKGKRYKIIKNNDRISNHIE